MFVESKLCGTYNFEVGANRVAIELKLHEIVRPRPSAMPPTLPQIVAGTIRTWRPSTEQLYSASAALANRKPTRRERASSLFQPRPSARQQSNHAAGKSNGREDRVTNPIEALSTLKSSLNDLQKHFRSYVNLSRLQLALRALGQKPGEETIRVAILALPGQERTSAKVKELVRLLLADPLKEEEEWERALTTSPDSIKPVLLRIGEDSNDPANHGTSNRMIQELKISSPTLNAHRLEILVMEADILSKGVGFQDDIGDIILVPSVEIPLSSTGKYTPITTPVHKALLVGDGIIGAAALVKLPVQAKSEIITAAVDLPGLAQKDLDEMQFQLIDVALAGSALASFRESVDNAMAYERDWFKSGVPELLSWLKTGTLDRPGGYMKSPVYALILSVLADASQRIQYEESRQLSTLLSSTVSSSTLESLQGDLNVWAQRAHTELRDQLDVAFEGGRWRKLRWWKMFWRVDDVSMIASDILYQRFLTDAENEIIYLAGKIEEAGVLKNLPTIQQSDWAYKKTIPEEQPSTALGSSPPPLQLEDILERSRDDAPLSVKRQPWPQHIPTTRSYLSAETLPALQALGQRLVLQTLTTSLFGSAFAGLIYVSSFSAGLYEAGAVAAFGIVWSMRRMQKKWETARKFWEGEVREEGRKAVRAVESIVREVLAGPAKSTIEGAEELQKARKAVEQAREALERANSHLDS